MTSYAVVSDGLTADGVEVCWEEDQFSELVSKNQWLLLEATDAKRHAEALQAKCFELSQTKWWTTRRLTVTLFHARGLRLGNEARRLCHLAAHTADPHKGWEMGASSPAEEPIHPGLCDQHVADHLHLAAASHSMRRNHEGNAANGSSIASAGVGNVSLP